MEAMRRRVPIEISRDDLEALVEGSGVVLKREKHRLLHASDWQRWGSRGGRETLRRYGTEWFALLALRRWRRLTSEDLDAAREIAPLGGRAGIVFKSPRMAFNERKGR